MDDIEAAVIAAAEEQVRASWSPATWPDRYACLACYLHRTLPRRGCDGKLTLTHEWQLQQRILGRSTGGLTAFLKRHGGYCDCEVLMNVYPDREPEDDLRAPCSHPRWQ